MPEPILTGLMMDDYPLTLTAFVERAELLTPARPVVSRLADGSIHRTTLGACARRARRLAAGLAALGIGPGDRVGTLLWNQHEHLELYFAVPSMGAAIHTLNPRLHPNELTFIAADAGDRAIVVDETLLPVLASLGAGWRFEHVIVVSRDGELPAGMIEYESLLESGEPMSWPVLDERAAAAICYTSGTTGKPKGVAYSHRALVLHSLVVALPDQLGISGRESVLPVVPMFHANAWGLPYITTFAGAALVLPGPRLDAESVLDLLAGERVTMTAGVPTVWMAVLEALDAEPDRWDLSALRWVMFGGAAPPVSLLRGFGRHGIEVMQGWGMTETSPVASTCRLPLEFDGADADARYEYLARQGIPCPFVDIRARGDGGELIAWDDEEMGELEVRGPWVAAAYLRGTAPDKFTDDGWFQTGDIVRIDERGCIRICDRAKDLVKSGGEWISSVDLENLLMTHPAVAEAAVIAIPDDRWGERPLAVVVLRRGAEASPEELCAHLEQKFMRWQLPERFEFVDAIPRTATGKFKKTELREQFAGAGV
jgi:fatty-acyl-CoA synthase